MSASATCHRVLPTIGSRDLHNPMKGCLQVAYVIIVANSLPVSAPPTEWRAGYDGPRILADIRLCNATFSHPSFTLMSLSRRIDDARAIDRREESSAPPDSQVELIQLARGPVDDCPRLFETTEILCVDRCNEMTSAGFLFQNFVYALQNSDRFSIA